MSWASAKSSWAKAQSFIASAASRVISNRVSPEIRSLRVLSCHGGAGVSACPSRSFSRANRYHFCNDCGCGERELARISGIGSEQYSPIIDSGEYLKLDYPYLVCPAGRLGFSNSDPNLETPVNLITPAKPFVLPEVQSLSVQFRGGIGILLQQGGNETVIDNLTIDVGIIGSNKDGTAARMLKQPTPISIKPLPVDAAGNALPIPDSLNAQQKLNVAAGAKFYAGLVALLAEFAKEAGI